MSDEPQNGTQVAPREQLGVIPLPSGSILPQWWVQAYGPGVSFKTTLDKSDPKQRQQLLRAMNGEPDVAANRINTEMDVTGFTISPASRVVDGEVQEWVRCVLHLADGSNVAAGSIGVVKSLMLISQLDREPPWNPPIRLRLACKKLADGKQWYSLIPSDAPSASGSKGEGK